MTQGKVIDLDTLCGAKTQTHGGPCKNTALANGKCKYHGGSLPGPGPTHHRYKHGKYSKAIPTKLLENYEQSLSDPNLLTLKNEISLVDARLIELLTKVDQGEAGSLWKKAKSIIKLYESSNDEAEMVLLIPELFSLVKRGYKDHMTWQEIYPVLEQRKKLVESERKAYVEAGQMLTVMQASIMMTQVANAVNEAGLTKEQRQKIALTIRKILGTLSKPLELENE